MEEPGLKVGRRFQAMKKFAAFAVGTLLSIAATSGCNSLPKMNPMEMPFSSKEEVKDPSAPESPIEGQEFQTPASMGVIWTDSMVTVPGKPVTRGFGGRFFFYNAEGETIPVDGELTVYGFDDTDDQQQRKVADKKFVFRRSEMQGHAGQNDMGISYSFWIPWDAVGGDRMTVSILPIFKSSEGQMVRGEMAINILPGNTPDAEMDADSLLSSLSHADGQESGYRQVSYAEAADGEMGDSLNRSTIKTTTISVPQEMANQMRLPQAPVSRRPTLDSLSRSTAAAPRTVQTPGENQERTVTSSSLRRTERPRPTLNTGVSHSRF